jgi:hypothetical protein
MVATEVMVGMEIAKMALGIYFEATKQANLSEEEKAKLYEEEKMKFLTRNPSSIEVK